MKRDKASELLEKYHNGTCNEHEKAAVDTWYNFHGANQKSSPDIEDLDARKLIIWKKIQYDRNKQRIFLLNIRRFAAAACILIIAGISIYFYKRMISENHSAHTNLVSQIQPGKNGATLTLANGKKIRLMEAAEGELAKESGVVVTKTKSGELIYTVRERTGAWAGSEKLNELTTANGETFQVQLPDGTKAWLNAASSLKFPAAFSGIERNVELTGEAYFEVSKNKLKPFIVMAKGTRTVVLGTHFNIMAYKDEPVVKTTLIEGSVQLSKGNIKVVLKPGQEGRMANNDTEFSVTEVDANAAVAWKNGLFVFEDESLENIMKKIERWYNVEVVYQDVDKSLQFGASISRHDSVSDVLEWLELTGGIHFKIEGRRITVMK